MGFSPTQKWHPNIVQDSKQIKTLVLRCLDVAQEIGIATNLWNKLHNFRHEYMS